jgi:hypothetical protein
MKNQVLDTRDLVEKRDELKSQIYLDFKERFESEIEDIEEFEDFENKDTFEESDLLEEIDITDFLELWEDEFNEISEINYIEENCSDFQYGETLIHEDYFTEYCEELCQDCGYISKDFPSWIEIDWDATANNISADYSQCEYQGEQYLFRS